MSEETNDTGAATMNPPEADTDTVAGADENQRGQLRIDDTGASSSYASLCRVAGTAEEITIDFAQALRPVAGEKAAVLKVDHRATLSPWAAKRLAIALGQAIRVYENTYGELEIDPRKRQAK